MRRKYTQINGQGGDSHGNDLSGICGGGSENGDGDGGVERRGSSSRGGSVAVQCRYIMLRGR